MGLLDPATSDGRVIFFLPWLKGTIAGTTDLPCQVTHNPKPTEDEIQFILTEVKNYLNPDVEGQFVNIFCEVYYEVLCSLWKSFLTWWDKDTIIKY